MRRKFKTENFKSHFTLPFFQSFSFGLYRALHISPFPPWGLWMKRKTNYFFRLSNSLLIIEERKCEINDEECMYLLFYLLLVCEHQITICFLFVCLFVCLPSHSSHYWSYNACHYELLSFRSGTPLRSQRSEVRSLMETQNFSWSSYRKFAYFL